jgi:hypothetical protein
VAETIDWVRALSVVGATELTAETAADTHRGGREGARDLELVRARLDGIAEVTEAGPFVSVLVAFA